MLPPPFSFHAVCTPLFATGPAVAFSSCCRVASSAQKRYQPLQASVCSGSCTLPAPPFLMQTKQYFLFVHEMHKALPVNI